MDEHRYSRKTTHSFLGIITLLMSLLIISCSKVTVFDVSGDLFYKKYVGKRYETLKDMKAYFIKPRPTLGFYGGYEIMVHSGIQGHNVTQLGTVEKGSIIKVTKIYKYKEKMLLWPNIEFYVTIDNMKFLGKEFYIVGNSDAYVKTQDKKHETLNPKYFKER